MSLEIRLYGDLVDFGEVWELDVHSAVEAIRAIDANVPGFADRLSLGKYAFVVTDKDQKITDPDQVEVMDEGRCSLPISHKQVLRIVPVAEGETDPLTTLIMSWGVESIFVAEAIAAVVVAVAITVVLIGVSRLLMPAPPGMDETQEGEESYYFSGPVNTSRQGACVPVLYGGPLLVGSQVIGQTIVAEDMDDGDSETLSSKAYAELVDAISEGPIEGYVNADLESSIYLDGTPVKDAGTELFEGFSVEYRIGTDDQTVISSNLNSNPAASSVHSVGTVISKSSGGLVRTTQDPNIGQIKVTLNTGRFLRLNDKGDSKKIQVAINISVKGQSEPSYTLLKTEYLLGVAYSSYYRTISFDVDPAWGDPPYQIKLERITDDQNDNPQLSSEVYWASWSEVVLSKCSYPYTALALTRFDAEKFSSLPTRGFLMKGLKVKIPANYNPITRVYTGSWGGLFAQDTYWTNNPAWVFYDLATNPRYGLGRYLTEDLIDKWALYSIAQYCDELVDDGFGGQEPRFTCNLYLQTKAEAFSVLKELASAFRSIFFWTNGQLRLQQDSPATVYAQFSPANVINGEFTYSGTPKHTRYTVALVSWINPEDNYSTWVEYVEDPAGIQLYGVRETSITAVGCTSRGQAHRVGKYALLTSRLETDAIAFKTGMDGLSVTPGKIMKIIDPLHNQSEESVAGRISSVSMINDTVVLDRPVTLSAGHTYHITFTLPDMTQSSHTITIGSTTVTPPFALPFTPALSQEPVEGAMWSITDDAESARLYRVMTVAESTGDAEGSFEISGVRYEEQTLTESDEPGGLEPPDVPPINPGLSSPSALVLEEGVLPVGTSFRRYIDAVWAAPATGVVDRYTIVVIDPSSKETTYVVRQTDFRLYDVVPGEYIFSVRAVNVAGQVSAPVSANITVEELAPIDLISITGLELKGKGNVTEFEGRDAEFVWRLTSAVTGELGLETFGGDTGIPDPWFRDYEVTVYDENGERLRVDHVYDRNYIYSYEKNLEDGGPRRTFEVGVRARDIFNRTTDESSLEVTNPPPIGFVNITLSYGIELIVVRFRPPSDNDYSATRVYVSELTGFVPDVDSNLAYEGSDVTVTISNLPAEYYYVRLEGVDAFGPSGVYTDELSIHVISVERIHDQIAGEIQESWLYQSLNDRIDLIDTPNIGLVDRVGVNEAAIQQIQEAEFVGLHTYYQDTDPQLGVPAPGGDIPVLLEGDLWINTSSGDLISRWNGTAWDNLASGGNKVFYGDGPPTNPITGQPPNPLGLSPGDYWVDTHDYGDGPANVPYMWTGSEWINVSHGLLYSHAASIDYMEAQITDPYTGDSAMAIYIRDVDLKAIGNQDQISAQADLISNLGVEVSYKNHTYYQPSTDPPSTPTPVHGDLWFHTDDNNHPFRYNAVADNWDDIRDSSATGATTWIGAGVPDPNDSKYTTGDLYFDSDNFNYPYHFTGTTWESIQDGSVAGIVTFYQDDPPGPPYTTQTPKTGDLWFDTDADNKIHRYDTLTSNWVPVTDGTAIGVIPYIQPNMPMEPPTIPLGSIWIDSDDDDKPYLWDGVTWVPIEDDATHTIIASTAVERHARVTADKIGYAEYSIKVDVNGHIAGIGLGVSGTESGPIRSSIIMLADQFGLGFPTTEFANSFYYSLNKWVTPTQAWIDAHGTPELQPDGETLYRWDKVYRVTIAGTTQSSGEPNWPTTDNVTVDSGGARFRTYPKTATLPFVTGDVVTNLGEVDGNGEPVPEEIEHGIIISNLMIGNAAIANAHILDATITSAKIYTLEANKLEAGTINMNPALGDGNIYLGSDNFALTSATRRLTVKDLATNTRVELGGLSTGGYGIMIKDAAGQVMMRSGGDDTINGTYISEGTISSLAIENQLTSDGFSDDPNDRRGFRLSVNGAGAGAAEFNELSIYNNLGELILHSGSSPDDFAKAGSGVNIMPGEYANFENPAAYIDIVQGTYEIDETEPYFAGSCLKVTCTGNYNMYFALAKSLTSTGVNLKLTPGKKWIVSFWAKANVSRNVYVYFSTGASDYVGASAIPVTASSTYTRYSTTIDMTAHTTVIDAFLKFYVFSNAAGQIFRFDGIMVEQQVGSATWPSAYYGAFSADQAAGANQVFNSHMYPHDSGWLYGEENTTDPANWTHYSVDETSDPSQNWHITPGVTGIAQISSTTTGYAYIVSKRYFAVDSTKRYQAGALTGAHRCTVDVHLNFFDVNKNYVGSKVLASNVSGATDSKLGGPKLIDWFDHNDFIEPADIPASASYARILIIKRATQSGQSNSYAFATHAFFAEVAKTQPYLVPYSVGFESISYDNKITASSRGTYIADATIDTAAIADLAVDYAKITNAAVDTLKIAGEAVTIPRVAVLATNMDETGNSESFFSLTMDTTNCSSIVFSVGLEMTTRTSTGYQHILIRREADQSLIKVYIPTIGDNTGDTYPGSFIRVSGGGADTSPLPGNNTYTVLGFYVDMIMHSGSFLFALGAKR